MYLLPLLMLAALLLPLAAKAQAGPPPGKVVLVIHGGAGAIPRAKMTPEREKQYRHDLERALRAGHAAVARASGTSLDAVEAAIRVLEDSPLFNAGKGAVFTHEGRNELDAALMEGTNRAGAVASITRVKNPISAARAVMEKSEHVLLVGEGADRFALSHGCVMVNPTYFWTEERWQQLQQALQQEEKHGGKARKQPELYFGTVGAVCRDRRGILAAGTSTGGMTNKRPGRVGDTPIIGAGTYADNGTCAVSGTGHGETFIRRAVAHDLAARMKYKKLSLKEAADEVFRELPKEKGGVGGLIAIDRDGNYVMPFNTGGMYRGTITEEGKVYVAIYPE